MADVESSPPPLTLADLAQRFGPMPAWRIRSVPAPGTATEHDVVEIEARENRLCELVEGVLVEKTVGFLESVFAVRLARRLGDFVETHNHATLTGGDVLPGFSLPLKSFFTKPKKD